MFDLIQVDLASAADAVQALYDGMDSSLRFKPQAPPEDDGDAASEPAPTDAATPDVDRETDLRGVVCPLNYVRTKMVLQKMASGQVLSVLVDDDGARNVPESVGKDGHEVLAANRRGDHWQLIIRRQ